MASRKEILEIGGREVSISNPDKVYFPETGYTKIDLVSYYLVGRGRRAARRRRPADGPEAVRRRRRRRAVLPEAGAGQHARLDPDRRADVPVRADGRRDRPRRARPGWPGSSTSAASTSTRTRSGPRTSTTPTSCGSTSTRCRACAWSQIRDVALVCREALEAVGLVGWPKTSGSRGIHINVRIEPTLDVRRGPPGGARARPRRRARGRRRSRRASGGRRSATASSSTTTRTPRTGPSRRRTRSGRCRTRGSRCRSAGTRSPTSTPRTSRSRRCPAIVAERGDAGAGIDDARRVARGAARAERPPRGRGRGRRAVAAELREAGRRAAARPAVAGPPAEDRVRRGPRDRGRAAAGGRRRARRGRRRRRPERRAADRVAGDAAEGHAGRLATDADRPTEDDHPGHRDQPGGHEGGGAGGPRALEGTPSRGGRAPRAGRRPDRRDARPLVALVPGPGEPDPRAGGASARPGGARPRLRPVGRATSGRTGAASSSGHRARSDAVDATTPVAPTPTRRRTEPDARPDACPSSPTRPARPSSLLEWLVASGPAATAAGRSLRRARRGDRRARSRRCSNRGSTSDDLAWAFEGAGAGLRSVGRMFAVPAPRSRPDLRRARQPRSARSARRLPAIYAGARPVGARAGRPPRERRGERGRRRFAEIWADADPGGEADVRVARIARRLRAGGCTRAGSTSGTRPPSRELQSQGAAMRGRASRPPRIRPTRARTPSHREARGRSRLRRRWLHERPLEATLNARIIAAFEYALIAGGPARGRGRRGRRRSPSSTCPGYTSMTVEHGDEAAATAADRLPGDRRGGRPGVGGRLVKLLGDGVLLRFPDAPAAIRGRRLDLVEPRRRSRPAAGPRRDRGRPRRRPRRRRLRGDREPRLADRRHRDGRARSSSRRASSSPCRAGRRPSTRSAGRPEGLPEPVALWRARRGRGRPDRAAIDRRRRTRRRAADTDRQPPKIFAIS